MRLFAWTCVCSVALGVIAVRAGGHDPAVAILQTEEVFIPAPLAFSLHYDDPRSTVGWGSFDLRARPAEHEFRVDLMLGTATAAPRWNRCDTADVLIDGGLSRLPVRHSGGVPMSSGVWDAVHVELTIDHVRAMAAARNVSVDLCGYSVMVHDDKLGQLVDFVHRFEEMATYDGPPAPEPPPPLDWEPELPEEDLGGAPVEA